jgi:hypothetical protein
MIAQKLRIAIVVVAGLLAPLWWSWAVSNLAYAFYIAAGAPKAPSAIFSHASVVIPSMAIGLIAGTGVAYLSSSRPIACWLVFWISVLSSMALIELISGDSIIALVELFHSPGNLAFLIASVVVPAYAHSRRTPGEV